ncbi:20S proteasome subunit alpha 3 [Nematocida ausubeli]|nr:20S proteasome subunit alpha 3 [Nematocida ausubeli]
MDRHTNTFSEEGRIHQVEYAIKSISSAGPAIGIKCVDGVVLLGKTTDDDLSLTQDEKIYQINDNTVAIVSGLYADSNLLVNYARVVAQEYLMKYDVDMSPRQIAMALCKIKQKYTQGGGMRPFGVSFLFAGWNEKGEYGLYSTDPSGTLFDYTACAFGEGDKLILPVLNEHKEESFISEGIQLAFKGIATVAEGRKVLPHTITCAVVTKVNGKNTIKMISQKDITECLQNTREVPK